MAFPVGSDTKESACNAGDLGWIPGLGRSPGVGHGNPLQYSCLENSHGQRSLVGCSPWCHQVRHDWVTKHILANGVKRLFMNATDHSYIFFAEMSVQILCCCCCCCWVAKSCLTLCNAMDCSISGFPILLLSPGVCSNSDPLSQWCHLTISSSATIFSFCLQSFPASGSFPVSCLFISGGQTLELQLQNQSFQWMFRVDFL